MKNLSIYFITCLAAFTIGSQSIFAQCNVSNTGTAAAPTCSYQNLSLGAGESRNLAFTGTYYYDLTFSDNAQSSGMCINGTRYTAATTVTSLNATYAIGMYRNTGTWTTSSATLSYRFSTPSTPGTPSISSNGCTSVTIQWAAASNASGYEVQVATDAGFASILAGNNCGGQNCAGSADIGNVTSTTITGLTANTPYFFRVRARNGSTPCRSAFSSTLSFTTAANASISSFTRTDNGTYCIGGNGTVTVNRAGGTGSYSYVWGGSGSGTGQSTATSATNNSTAGAYTYSVTVTPSGTGCATASSSTTMTSYNDPVTANPTGSDAICKGGSITLTAAGSGGVPSAAYTYFWRYSGSAVANGTPNGFSYSGTPNLTIATTNSSSATPGAYNYQYYVTQPQSGCQSANSSNGTLTLANDPSATINAPYGGTATCVPQTGVTLGVTVAGGVSQVYNWQRFDTPSWTNVQANNSNYTTGTLVNASTLYRFTFTGGIGCDAVTTPNTDIRAIPDAPVIPGGTTQSGCGQVVIGATPATFATTCRFYNGFLPNGSPTTSGTSYSYTSPGSYTLYVTSYNPTTGCESTTYATITVTVSPSFTSAISSSNYNGYGVSCIGGANGTATVTVTGATAPVNYVWSSGVQTLGSPSLSNTISSLSVGSYTVTVTDANNCVKIESISLSAPPAITSTISTSNNSGYAVSCNGGSNGSATVSASGGVGAYSYAWQGGGATQTRTGYAAGTYNVTVTDINSCNHVNSVVITEPTAVVYTHSVGYVCSGSTYSSANIVINAAGGTGNYQYSINNGTAWQVSNTFSGLSSGSYTLRVKDVNNGSDCVAAGQTITVTIPASVQASESCGYTYATANGGDPTGTFATPSCPVTLARAIFLVTNDGSFASRKHIIVTSGTYTLSGPVFIPADVIIDGGYDNTNPAQWVKTSSGVTSITINSTVETATQSGVLTGFVRGFVINGNNVQFKDLTINVNTTSPVTGTTSNRGRSVYGIYADGRTGVLVSRCIVNTGAGSAGDTGAGGSNGTNGGGGGNASPQGGCDDSPYQNGGSGGGGGTVSWGANGGGGGNGGHSEEGNASNGGNGGNGANNGSVGVGGGMGSDGGSCGTGGNAGSGSGGPGGAGDNSVSTVATAGTDYNPASPAGPTSVSGTFYLPSGQAAQGGHGRGGSGGGGGGGTRGENTSSFCPYNDNSGNPGAGGGGGGAGGEGGYGGYGGGGSFPVFFSGGTGEVRDCSLNPGSGGSGGTGGFGGFGGYGGGGGGGSCYCQSDRACSGSGAAGGNGARGGRGQTGATGASQGFTTTNSSSIAQNGTSIPNPTSISAAWTQGCRRSEITLTKSSSGATWDNLGSGANNPVLVNDLTASTSSYTNTSNSVKVYYGAAAAVGNKDITVSGQTYRNYLKIVGDRAHGDAVINSISSPCPSGTITLGTTTAGANVAEYAWSIQLLSNPTINLLTYNSQNPGAVGPPIGGWTAGATYQVELRVRENCCGWSIPAYATFTVLTLPAQPSAIVEADNIVCASQNGAGYSVTNVPGTTYTWAVTSGSGNIATGQGTNAVTVNWGSAGPAVLQVTPSSGCGAGTPRTLSVTVNTNPIANISPSNPSICAGSSQTLNATASAGTGGNGTFSYIWSNSSTATNISVSTTNTYSVTVTEGVSGCSAVAATILTVNPLPTPSVSGTLAICDGGSTTLTASGGTSYSWSTSASSTSITVSPLINTTYTVTATSNGCTASAFVNVTVSPVANVDAGNAILSCGGTAAITMSGATASGSYSANTWTGGGGLGTWSQNADPALATFTPGSAVGSFTATLTLTGSGGCSNVSDTRVISWNSGITGLTATLSANPACEGSDVTLNASVSTGSVASWSWSGPNSYSDNTQNPTIVGVFESTNEGIYTVTASNVCGTVSASTAALNVHPNVIGLTANYPSAICEGSDLSLTATYLNSILNSGDVVWSWSGPNSFTASVQNPTRTNIGLADGGIYEISATNACGTQSASGAILQIDANIIADADPNMLAAAGFDNAVIEACGTLVVNLQGNDPSPGAGQWSLVPNSLPNSGTVVSYSPDAQTNNVAITYSQIDPLPVSFRWTITNGTCPPSESDVRVIFDPAINITAQTAGCSFTSADSILVQVSASGGTGTLSYTAPTSGELRVDINANNKAYTVPMNGGTHAFNVSDAFCTATQNVGVPNGHPIDVAYSVGTGTTVASCYQADFNKWTTYSDNANGAILAINDNGQNLGQVNVTVYKDAFVHDIPQSLNADNCQGYNGTAMQRHFMVTAQNAFSNPIGLRVYFTNDELQALISASQSNDALGDICSETDNIYDINGLYLTKYTGIDEDGDYTNNSPSGLYKVYGDATSLPIQPDGPMNKSNGGFSTVYSGAQSHHYAELSVSEFSELWLHGSQSGAALPVEMLYLEANAIDNSYIQVKWATLLEINNNGFQVERSTDGLAWDAIGWVDGNNNTTTQIDYAYNDNAVTSGIRYYYRLKQVDNDGAYDYTGIVSAIINKQFVFSIKDFIPNPAMSTTSMIVLSNNAMEVEVNFFNVIGEVMLTAKHQLNAGSNVVNFDVEGLAAGTYTAVISSANEVYSKKLVILK